MKGRRAIAIGALAASLLAPGASFAQAAAAPDDFDALLERVRAGWRQERADNREREAAFVERKQEQQQLLGQATRERARLEERSQQLESAFQKGEVELAQLEAQLAERLGNLGELFGVVRQVAGDTRGQLEASLVSAQYPGRAEALGALAESRRLPSIAQLEGLWHELLREAAESGRVVRFRTEVVEPGGAESPREVVRAGAFNALSGGEYLEWRSDIGRLAVLPRQPARRFRATAQALSQATEGSVAFALDPSRGSILSRLVQTPSLRERIGFGGSIGYAILGLGGLTVLFGLVRVVDIGQQRRRVAAQKASEQTDPGNALGRVLAVYEAHRGADPETLERMLDETVLRESSRLERGLWLVKVMSVLAPLGGLLGTVTGMIQTFQAITLFGAGDPRMMAGGISEALVTTMLGLLAAIPLVLLHSWAASLARDVADVLDEQSAGLVARRAEAQLGGES